MTERYIALLRAVNVGGSGNVAMAALLAALERAGFTEVRTVLQSGNVVFRSDPAAPEKLERELEALFARRLGLTTEVFVRSAREWHEALAANPFPEEAVRDPSHLLLYALKGDPAAGSWAGLQAGIRGRERVAPGNRVVYAVYPDGVGRSKLTPSFLERHLGTRATGRNWNTAQRLERLVSGS